jgi:glycosyltransferase involved in cell wall biosynthesis
LDVHDDKIFYSQGKYIYKAWILLKSIAKRLNDVAHAGQYDFIFIQREAFLLGTTFFEKLFSRSKAKLIFDLDDAIWLHQISSSSPNKKLNFLKNPGKTAQIIAVADIVVAGNQYLANYALQYNNSVTIIPTTIETDLYVPLKTNLTGGLVTIGWSGSKTTIDHFREALPALVLVKLKYKDRIRISVIGDGNYRNEELEIQGKEWRLHSEIHDLNEFDIGIMPLPDDEWSKGKCGLKGLQYMALEIPTVMSPVGVNNAIIDHGVNGFLCQTEEDWVQCLEKLVTDAILRKKIGIEGRKKVISNYSVASNASTFLGLFS